MSMLKPRKRITKKQMKQDKLVTSTFQIAEFIQKKSRQIIYGALAVVILILIILVLAGQRGKKEQTASAQLSRAQMIYQMEDYTSAANMFESLARQYDGTKSGSEALYYLGNSHFFAGNYDAAQKDYEKYLHSSQKNPGFKASALAGIAACIEQKGQYGEAAKMYEKAGSEYRDFYAAPDYLVAAGICYQNAGDALKAREVYQKVVDRYPNAKPAAQAKLGLAQL